MKKQLVFAALTAFLIPTWASADGGGAALAFVAGVVAENYRNNTAAWEAFSARHPDTAPACLKAPSEKVKAEGGNYYFDRAPKCN